jgi:hypothetical protein
MSCCAKGEWVGLAQLGKDEYYESVLIGLVPAQALRASRFEATPTDPKTESRS